MESTKELLINYLTNPMDLPSKVDPDFSLYSDFNPDTSKLPNASKSYFIPDDYSIPGVDLSNLYDLLDDDSIEIRRSSMVETLLPMKRSSPSRKIKHDYQDQLFKARQSKLTFPNLNFPNELDESTFDTIEKNIDKFLKLQDNEFGDDKTELLIKETHKLVNNIPSHILSSKDGEKYSSTLTASINKVVTVLESVKGDSRKYKEEVSRLKNAHERQTLDLRSEVGVLRRERNILKEKFERERQGREKVERERDQFRRRVDQQEPQFNSQLKRENNLLRDKLIKYKKLAEAKSEYPYQLENHYKPYPNVSSVIYDKGVQTHKTPDAPPIENALHMPAAHGSPSTAQLKNIHNQISDFLAKKETHTYKMLPIFEEFIEKEPKSVEKPIRNELENHIARQNEELINLLRDLRDKNLKFGETKQAHLNEKHHEVHESGIQDERGEKYRSGTGGEKYSGVGESQSNLSEKVLNEVNKQPQKKSQQTSESSDYIDLLKRVLSTMDHNNELYVSLSKLIQEYKQGNERKGCCEECGGSLSESEVLSDPFEESKEYACRAKVQSKNEIGKHKHQNTKRRCAKCSGDTIEMMGVYQW